MSWVSLVSALMVCGVWHMMQSSTFSREPPWPISGSWHWLHALGVTTDRVTVTGDPFGTKVKASLDVSLHSSNVPYSAAKSCNPLWTLCTRVRRRSNYGHRSGAKGVTGNLRLCKTGRDSLSLALSIAHQSPPN